MTNTEYTIDTSGAGFGSRFLKPANGIGLVDVVNDFAWTLSPKESRSDVSRVFLKEFQQNGGQLIASLLYYARLAGQTFENGFAAFNPADPSEVYKFKYVADPTGWAYSFPFFSQNHTTRGNTFGYGDSKNPFTQLTDIGKNMLGFGRSPRKAKGLSKTLLQLGQYGSMGSGLIGLANTLMPGKISFESPQSWSGTDEESITISFHLFNTRSIDDVRNNRNLAHILRYNNTPNRKNFAIVDPPVIYSLFIPDVIHFPACYMATLDIKNLGNTRLMDTGDGMSRTIPEAYQFNMTFKSLLMPTRNILQSLEKGEIVQAISNNKLSEAINLNLNTSSDTTQGTSSPTTRPYDQQEFRNVVEEFYRQTNSQ